MRRLTVPVKFGDIHIECEIECEMEGSPYLPATWDYPEEGGLEKVTDAKIVVAYDIDVDSDDYGPSLEGMLLSDAQINDLWYDFSTDFDELCEGNYSY